MPARLVDAILYAAPDERIAVATKLLAEAGAAVPRDPCLRCSAVAPANELCQVTGADEQCPRCLRVFCYNCIQQHACATELGEALKP